MKELRFCDKNEEFETRIRAALATATIFGSTQENCIIDLIHFSSKELRDPATHEPSRDWIGSSDFNWSNCVSSSPLQLGALNGLFGRSFKNIYLLRAYWPNSHIVRDPASGLEEYSIRCTIPEAYLVKLPVVIDGDGNYRIT